MIMIQGPWASRVNQRLMAELYEYIHASECVCVCVIPVSKGCYLSIQHCVQDAGGQRSPWGSLANEDTPREG